MRWRGTTTSSSISLFSSEAEVKRYENLMNDVKTLVADKYDGSLKAEHGTGRNMALLYATNGEMQPMR